MLKFGIGVAAAVVFAATSANAACVKPSAIALLGMDIAGSPVVATQLFSFGGRQLQWATVSWEGPEDGNLFVVDCDGHQLAVLKADLGYTKDMKLGPVIDGKPTLSVSYVPASGTNIRELSAAILQFDGTSIAMIWSHSTFDGSYPPPSLGPEDELKYSWAFRDGYNRIDVKGTETVGYKTLKTHAPSGTLLLQSRRWQIRRLQVAVGADLETLYVPRTPDGALGRPRRS